MLGCENIVLVIVHTVEEVKGDFSPAMASEISFSCQSDAFTAY